MKRKLLIGIAVVLGIAAMIFQPMSVALILLVAMLYMVNMTRKKKAKIFHGQVEPELAERRLRRLKIFLRVGGVSFVVGIVGVVGHNVVYGLTEVEEPVFFTIGLVGLFVFFIATIGSLVIFLRGRRKQHKEIPK